MTHILALAAGVLCTACALVALAARRSATAVVIDLDGAGLALAVLAAPLLGWGMGSAAQPPHRRVVQRWVGGCALVLAVAAALGLAYPRLVLFHREQLRFANGPVQLAGTLYAPRHAPAAAVVLVHGSGPETRDQYRFYARWLAEHGVAALAYDKRGTGASSGVLYESTYAAYAGDVVAAVDAVTAHVDIAPRAVGLVGFSEAEWVAPLAA
ncbi:MAG TPA: alpha/beta hydrolase, partial [Vicinamibacterales bacterium]|nr:alpha/beta hydrolase [Vicinamibacterales bacterium]